jgi:UDP-N-acetylglucosamine--N-acetylmuramyl-(pentapeptide) pyrophosphoryl-undecaprenol N-acetylglucosamine transferase
MKFLITGGHLSPALAFIDYLLEKGDSAVFLGRDYSSSTYGVKSLESQAMSRLNIPFIALPEFKLNRHQPLKTVATSPRLIKSILLCRQTITTHQPQSLISFGGYLSIPAAIASRWYRLPIFIHEQTTTIGLANQVVSKFAAATALSYHSSLPFFKNSPAQVIGNLIRPQFFTPQPQPPWWPKSNQPVIYITGGNQGSTSINQTIMSLYSELTKHFVLIHQTGDSAINQSYLQCIQAQDQLSSNSQSHLFIRKHFSASEVAYILHHAHLVISRAGANTISEISAASIPSILIPLPGTHHNEQFKNAQMLASLDTAIIIHQAELNPPYLLKQIKQLHQQHHQFSTAAKKLTKQINPHAAKDFYQLVQASLNE